MKKARKNERGSALLMTLGILSLVLLLGMAFAFTARSSRQLARINADNIQSRLLAESGLNATLANLRSQTTAYFAHGLTPTKRGYGDSDHEDKYEFGLVAWGTDESDETSNGFASVLKSRSDYVNRFLNGIADADLPKGFVTVTDGTGSSAKVIGRYGILFMEESGKLDVNAIISPTATAPYVRNEPTGWSEGDRTYGRNFFTGRSTDEFYYNIEGNYTPCATLSYASPDTLRLGLAMNELRLTDEDYYTALPDNNGQKIPWLSYSHLLSDNAATDFGKANDNGIFTYTFFSGEEPEAYWDGTTERARFDLTGYEWGDGTYYDASDKPDPEGSWQDSTGGITYARTLVDALTGTTARPAFWDTTPTNGSRNIADVEDVPEPAAASTDFGIPYLYGKKQIAANLVDYCDEDDYATWEMATGDLQDVFDVNATTQTLPSDLPDYFGNEQVAYFNELAFDVEASSTLITPNNGDPANGITLTLAPTAELVNIFLKQVASSGYKIRIDGRVSVSVGGTFYDATLPASSSTDISMYAYPLSGEWTPFTVVYDGSYSAMNTGFKAEPLGSVILDDRTIARTSGQDGEGNPTWTAQNVVYKVAINAIFMLSQDGVADGKQCDFAYWWQGSTIGTGVEIFSTASASNWIDTATGDFDTYATLEARDPRCNYLPPSSTETTWAWRENSGQFWSTTTSFNTLEDMNTNFVESDEDSDSISFGGTNPKTYSTAFIRNAPMEGLWEMGLIHRGEPGKTLNIHTFKDADHADGDAAILDQVKIGPAKFSRGKYNANAYNPAVLALLMKGIGDAQALDDIIDGDFDFDTDDVDPDDFTNTAPSHNRGAFANKISGLFAADDDDLTKEAYMGRTANLLSTRYETFTIAIVGQSLRELDDDVDASNWSDVKKMLHNPTKYTVGSDDKYCDILGTQVILAHVVRDTWHNTCRIVQMQYL